MWKCICMAVALWGCTGVLQAKVVLPSVFTDNMVLQQKTDITFYGDATKNKQLTVKTGWNGKEYHTSPIITFFSCSFLPSEKVIS